MRLIRRDPNFQIDPVRCHQPDPRLTHAWEICLLRLIRSSPDIRLTPRCYPEGRPDIKGLAFATSNIVLACHLFEFLSESALEFSRCISPSPLFLGRFHSTWGLFRSRTPCAMSFPSLYQNVRHSIRPVELLTPQVLRLASIKLWRPYYLFFLRRKLDY